MLNVYSFLSYPGQEHLFSRGIEATLSNRLPNAASLTLQKGMETLNIGRGRQRRNGRTRSSVG
jgi:hypothetical protein